LRAGRSGVWWTLFVSRIVYYAKQALFSCGGLRAPSILEGVARLMRKKGLAVGGQGS